MLAAPPDGITLEDKRQITNALLRAGADIRQLNCVRKHLSRIKGGRLALAAGRCTTLAISDVHRPPDDPGTIGSGPTVADDTTFSDALRVLDEYAIDVPGRVREYLERGASGAIDETPKPGDERLRDVAFRVIANRRTAMDAAAREAQRRGYAVRIIETPTYGEARDAGRAFATRALGELGAARRGCVIASGETTVTVRGRGRGGRNQEFVLGAAAVLAQVQRPVVVGSAGTDGVDGPTDAAGGIAFPSTPSRLERCGRRLEDVLAENEAYAALARLGDLITWGPTLTNVGDVHVLLTMSP